MMSDNANPLLSFLENAYGPALATDNRFIAALEGISTQAYHIGQTIEGSTLSDTEMMIVLSGKIRVLYSSQSFEERTGLVLVAGDIVDAKALSHASLTFTTSSAEAVICRVPANLVMENTILQKHWDAIDHKVRSLEHDTPATVSSSPTPAVQKPVAALALSAATENPNRSPNAWFCVEQLLLHYRRPVPPAKKRIEDVQTLQKVIEAEGFTAQRATLNWSRLLNTDFPLILVDNGYHFITGRQGNTLIAAEGGKTRRHMPQNTEPTQHFEALLVKPVTSQAASGEIPYTLGWYVKLCVQNWFLSTQMILSSLLVQIFSLGMPLFYVVIFDRVFGRMNLNTLDVMTVGIAILIVFDLLVKLLRSYVLSHQLEMIDKSAFQTFLQKAFDIPLSKATPQTIRSYAERFPELVKMNQSLASMLLMTSMDVIFSVLLVIFLLLLHTQLALISLASLVPIVLSALWTAPGTKKRAIDFNREQRQCQVKLTEVLEHNETVKSLNASGLLKWEVAGKIEEHLQRGFGARFDRINAGTGQGFIINAGSIVTLYYGAHAVLMGEISFGIYIAINMLSRQVIGSVQKLFASVLQFQEAMGTLEQFQSLYADDVETEDTTKGVVLPQVSGHIHVADVSFRYHADMPWALNHINLTIEPGQKVVLVGKSGSGKTTLIRLLDRLYEPNSGHITLDQYNLADINLENIRQHVGVALQRPALFTGTIAENIALGNPSATTKEIIEAATMAQLDKDLLTMPQGLDSPVMAMGNNLSGGQAARIALARIFLRNPSILILDEALSACDPSLNGAIFTRILDRYQNATCLFVTDYMPVHEAADAIVVLNEGQVVEYGTYPELVRKNGYYANLFYTHTTQGKQTHEALG